MSKPKYFIDTEIHHPAVVSTPVLLGVKNVEDEIERRNTITGEVVSHQ